MSRVILSDLSENKVVLPTNVSTFDRNRQRSVVFYGRVSTDMNIAFNRLIAPLIEKTGSKTR